MSKPSATYQQLQDVMKRSPGCPVCAIGLETSRSYLDGLLWESVNDSGVRAILKKSLGFCGRHSRELLTFSGQRVGVAMLQRAILQTAATELDRPPSPLRETFTQRLQDRLSSAKDKSSIIESRATLETCPACIQQQQAETRAIHTLLDHFPGDFVGPLQNAGGLCWPHLQQAFLTTTDATIYARGLSHYIAKFGLALSATWTSLSARMTIGFTPRRLPNPSAWPLIAALPS